MTKLISNICVSYQDSKIAGGEPTCHRGNNRNLSRKKGRKVEEGPRSEEAKVL